MNITVKNQSLQQTLYWLRRLGETRWSESSGNLSRHFNSPLNTGTGSAPSRWGGETLVENLYGAPSLALLLPSLTSGSNLGAWPDYECLPNTSMPQSIGKDRTALPPPRY